MRTKSDRQGGFTLVELLVALVLLGLLSTALFTSLRIGAKTLDRTFDRTSAISSLASADAVLEKTLQAAYPEYIPGVAGDIPGRVMFNGSAETVTFLAPAPLALAAGGMAQINVSFSGNAGSQAIVITAEQELAAPVRGQVVTETLTEDIKGGNISYWGNDAPNDAAYWHSNWQNRSVLPRLVRFHIDFPQTHSVDWPDFVVALKIRTDESCQFIPLRQSCFGR